jgi:hypothetical protein
VIFLRDESAWVRAIRKVEVIMRVNRCVSTSKFFLLVAIVLLWHFASSLSALAQSPASEQIEARSRAGKPTKVNEEAAQEAQLRAFAVSLIISLGTEARSYNDLALRPRVLARAAEVLWDSDLVTARSLFRRAWEAAEKGDAEASAAKPKDNVPNMVTALRQLGGKDLRVEVMNLVARRDPILANEFLMKLKSTTEREATESTAKSRSGNGWSTSEVISKRLQAASQMLNEGQIQSALDFASPGLNQVTADSINFLTNLRAKSPEVADQRFAMLMSSAEQDPLSDANTVSGLSSYVFTPGFYITFSADGSAFWTRPNNDIAPPVLPSALRNQFFVVAGNILLQPLPPADRDFSSSGRKGKYQIVKHLLPLFEQYAPDTAVALHAQLTELAGKSAGSDQQFAPQESKQSKSAVDTIEKMQDELDHSRTSKERDEILGVAAVRLAVKGDVRARDVASRIDDSELRSKVQEYVDFEFIQIAIRKKDAPETARLAKAGHITHSQRAWAYTEATRLLPNSERENALEFLGEAAAEIQRIENGPRDRAILLVGVARRLLAADRERAWLTMSDAVKAANQADNFTGENLITFSIGVGREIKFNQIGSEEGGLAGVFQLLAKYDLNRSVELAKCLKNDAPRAAATLAIAASLLNRARPETLSPTIP